MSEQDYLEVYRALRDAQSRYTYFLLAASGAAIGLAVNETHASPLLPLHAPLGLAVLCWGASFYFGCLHLRYVQGLLRANADLLKMNAGVHPLTGPNPAAIQVGRKALLEVMDENSTRTGRYGAWQFRFLIAGAVCFLAWHVWLMYARSVVAGI